MKTIIITGGTCEIGYQTIKKLCLDYNVVFTYYNNKQRADKIAKETFSKGYKVKLESQSSIKKFFKQIQQKKIYHLIHIAAQNTARTSFEKLKDLQILQILNANCIGSTLLFKKTIELMKKNNGEKSIISISSQAAKYGGNKLSVYASSKAYIDGLCLSLSKELRKDIRINTITLGKVETEGLIKNWGKNSNLSNDIPLKRLGTPEEIADTIKIIIENFKYLSGSDIKLTGGR